MYYFLASKILSKADDGFVDNVVGATRFVFGNILNVIRIFGTGVALIMLTWMSISYFTADGRSFFGFAEKKAKIKGEQLKNFAIGAIVFIGASNILYFVTEFVISVVGAWD